MSCRLSPRSFRAFLHAVVIGGFRLLAFAQSKTGRAPLDARLRCLLPLVLAAVLGFPRTALASEQFDNFPFRRGTVLPTFGIGFGFGSDIQVLNFGVGASYFVLHGFALGLRVEDTVYIYRESFRQDFPGVEDTSPTNAVLLLPTAQYVFARRYSVSPFVTAGVGPVFYNHQRGTVGQWLVGAGAYIRLASSVRLALGINFLASFPDDEWKNAFAWDPPPLGAGGIDPPPETIRACAITSSLCSFNIAPQIGVVVLIPTRDNRWGAARSRGRSFSRVSN